MSGSTVGTFGLPIFLREILAHARRTRTYVFQTIFLAVLVFCLIPLWPASTETSGADIADTARKIFEDGAYLQVLLLLLLAPAITANAIVEEKANNTLDLLLLTNAGPFAIVWGKFFSRLFNLFFLLFLTLPILFALLTLGGISGTDILIQFTILLAFGILCAGLGIFLSTIFPKTTPVLMVGYLLLALLLVLPLAMTEFGILQVRAGTYPLLGAEISPIYDMMYLFRTSKFVSTESFPNSWWICPLWNVCAGLTLVMAAGLLLPKARSFERVLSLRKVLDAFDRLMYFLIRLRFGAMLRVLKGAPEADEGRVVEEARPIGEQNPIYWKETSINTIGRNRYWWRVNLGLLALLVISYAIFSKALPKGLSNIEFHRYMVATLTGIMVLLSTIIAATTVSQEREDGTLRLLAATPIECSVYVKGKVRGVTRNIIFLVAFPFLHVVIWVFAGVVHPVTLVYLALSIPFAVVAQVMQGIFVSLMQPTTLRALMGALILVIIQAALPLVCCLPTFNLPLTSYFMVEPVTGLGSILQAAPGTQTNYLTAMLLALVFSAGTQVGYTVVVYSLIRSGFDRYIGRAA